MPSKTRSGAQSRVGRPKADPMSCATKSYKKSHPNTNLMSCSASQTCRAVPGKSGKRCTMKRKPGRVAGPKKVKTEKKRGRPVGARHLFMKELPFPVRTPKEEKKAKKAKKFIDELSGLTPGDF